ncbi:MAG TPA: hypothetical protein VFE82_04420 [Ramlibacter sp.]|jgi:hypothetical protein|uniref:hypothetical protein n=1 Tax=Ramlibacter sp. TaxID=1917967 RepID=UPI002D74B7CF|nr:hypothetical protein [Ramlibacter sp.]HZY17700.1 hypothetical protein [Ramlibacter sp.]
MQRTLALLLSSAIGCLALPAHAVVPVRAADLPASNDGGTGFIGVAASGATGWHAEARQRTPAQALGASGEASTLVDGRPNVQSPMSVNGTAPAVPRGTAMGAGGPATHRAWGTPD